MENESLAKTQELEMKTMESVLVEGDLSKLTVPQRLSYYKNLCETMGLNPLSKPFGYIIINNRLTLYALKDCTEQLRKIHGVGITDQVMKFDGGLCIVTVKGQDRKGRSDIATGAVDIKGLTGEKQANAIMKAETKAKRRLTLSLVGLGMLDESEAYSVDDARIVDEGVVLTKAGEKVVSVPYATQNNTPETPVEPPAPVVTEIEEATLVQDPLVTEQRANVEAAPPVAVETDTKPAKMTTNMVDAIVTQFEKDIFAPGVTKKFIDEKFEELKKAGVPGKVLTNCFNLKKKRIEELAVKK